MLFLDVNICIHAIRSDQAGRVSDWLTDRANGSESVGISEFVLAAMTRIVTQRRIFADPSTPEQCVEFGNALLAAPAVTAVRPGARHWQIFGELVTTLRLRGNDVPDAYLAAIALEQGATMVTLDRGFARFPDLGTVDPLA